MARSIATFLGQGSGPTPEVQSAHTHDEAARMGRLTPRQLDVLGLLAKGLSNEQLGTALTISTATVRAHVAAILNTLDAGNRTEAAAASVAFAAQPAQVEAVLPQPSRVGSRAACGLASVTQTRSSDRCISLLPHTSLAALTTSEAGERDPRKGRISWVVSASWR